MESLPKLICVSNNYVILNCTLQSFVQCYNIIVVTCNHREIPPVIIVGS